MPNPQTTLEKIHFLVYPEDEKIILELQQQKKPFFCKIGLFHKWSKNHNGVRYCMKCGHVDFYFGLTGIIRKMEEKGEM